MTHLTQRALRGLIILPVVAATAALPAATAFAAPAHTAKPHIKVMTRNLYLGADLTPLLSAADPLAGIVSIVSKVEASKPDVRMGMVAHEIEAAKPDLVALQEVANWQIPGKSPLDGTTQVVPAASYNFLTMLQNDLAAAGSPYRVVVSETNFNSATQLPAGLALLATYSDRDVILARKSAPTSLLKVTATHAAHYTHQLTIPLSTLGVTVNFTRGYEWADLVTKGTAWRLVNTHPEAYTPAQLGMPGADVNGPEAKELATALKSYKKPLVIAGDLNSAKGETDRPAYTVFTKAGFSDTWLKLGHPDNAFTCCHNETLSGGALTSRIDHVLTRGAVAATKASHVGVAPESSTAPKWASDHAGVLTTLAVG
ncbi:MAG TPA: endonuclease/exonuclease/phosphatase family protein [Mycobacteriales bacterium]|nr:endonuclease/exonuclease/phosphatase family protein [Mycobacteriales bacterium]